MGTLWRLLPRHFPLIPPFFCALFLTVSCVSWGRQDVDAKRGKCCSPPSSSSLQTSLLAARGCGTRLHPSVRLSVPGSISLTPPHPAAAAITPHFFVPRRWAAPKMSARRHGFGVVSSLGCAADQLCPLTLLYCLLSVLLRASRLRRWRISSPF